MMRIFIRSKFACLRQVWLMMLGLLIVISATNCTFLKMDLRPKEEYEEKFITGNEKSKDKILLLPINGIILEGDDNNRSFVCTPRKIQKLLHKAGKDKNIKAIILEVDSPGGGVTASDIIYEYLKEFKKAHPKIPILCLMKGTAASGAYYIAMAADYIMAHPTSITGSIGVISIFATGEELFKWAKLEIVVIKSGEAKDSGSFFRRMKSREKKAFQKIIDEMYEGFVKIVAEGRHEQLSREEILPLADGRIFTGQEAYKNKLVDALGYLDDVVNKAKELAGLTDARVIKYHKILGFLESSFRIETPQNNLDRLQDLVFQQGTGRFMYLWMPGVR